MMPIKDDSGRWTRRGYRVGAHLFLLPFSVSLLVALGLLAKISLSRWVWLPVALAHLAIALDPRGRLLGGEESRRERFLHLGLVAAALGASLGVAALSFDFSWDGMYYHQLGILEMASGWNPFNLQFDAVAAFGPDVAWLVTNMTKFTWYYQAALYQLTGVLELGKHLNLILMLSAFLISASTLRHSLGMRLRYAIGIPLLAVLNPVAVNQVLTFYVDGCLSSLLVAMLALGIRYGRERRHATLALLAATLAAIVNVKLTGGVYAAILVSGFVLWTLVARRWKEIPSWMAAAACAGLAASAMGYSPFFINWKKHADPIKPLKDAQAQPKHDPYQKQRPAPMRVMSPSERFAVSLFSVSSNYDNPPRFQLKVPFSVTEDELRQARVLDCRVGGFGPWFSGALLLAAFGLLWRMAGRDRNALWIVGAGALLVASVLINPEAWWVRFVPHAWLLPLLPLVIRPAREIRGERWLAAALAAVLAVNAAVVGTMGLGWQLEKSRENAALLSDLAGRLAAGGPHRMDFGTWRSTRYRLEQWGIRYVDWTGKGGTCNHIAQIGFAPLRICEQDRIVSNAAGPMSP